MSSSPKHPTRKKARRDPLLPRFPSSFGSAMSFDSQNSATTPTGLAGTYTPPNNLSDAATSLPSPHSQPPPAFATNGTTSMNTTAAMQTTNGTNSGGAQGQGQQDSFTSTTGNGQEMTGVIGGGYTADSQQQSDGWAPGAWKTKKAHDEMQRAWESVADKDWSPKEFGDVAMRGKQQRAAR